MNRNFTHYNSSKEQKNAITNMRTIMLGPSESTLDFIRQFARVYQFEPKLELSLGSLIIN